MRKQVQYTFDEIDDIKDDRNIFDAEVRKLVRSKPNPCKIYDNQYRIADMICDAFQNKKLINVMVIAKTQSGKTGSMLATINAYTKQELIPIEHIYVITGLSSCEWKSQTKIRMPKCIQPRVFHRNDLEELRQFEQSILNEETKCLKRNVLIIMDEIHVAAQKEQTIYELFKRLGLLELETLYEHDIKLLEYSATPDGTLYDQMQWKKRFDASIKLLADSGKGYVGSYDMLLSGRLKQYKDLCGIKDELNTDVLASIEEIKTDIYSTYLATPKYHIIRTKNCKNNNQERTIENFQIVFTDTTKFQYIRFDGENTAIKDINDILIKEPAKHTFIFIKEMLRCSKTLIKKHIGILYERKTDDVDDSTILQGLVGRNTGYDDNGQSIVYTNLDSIKRYEMLWNCGFEDKSIRWNSKTTRSTGGETYGKKTFNLLLNLDTEKDFVKDDVKENYNLLKFMTFAQVKQWFQVNKAKYGTGPHNKQQDEYGFYTSITQFCKKSKVRTPNDFKKCIEEMNWGFRGKAKEKNKYRVYPVYKNINDLNSLEWWLIYY